MAEFQDESHLDQLLNAIQTEAEADASLLESSLAVAKAQTLDALLVGPAKAGKSTVLGSLLGRLASATGTVASSVLPVAFSVKDCPEQEAERAELRVPAALRSRLLASTDSLGYAALPPDGIVQGPADLGQRLAIWHHAARAAAEQLLLDPQSLAEPLEVISYEKKATARQQRWRFVDFPGIQARSDLAVGRLISSLLESWLQASTTAVLICVVAKDQIDQEATAGCLAPLLCFRRPRLWVVNKVDNEGDVADVQAVQTELDRLTSGDQVFYVSAQQMLAHYCAEKLRKNADHGSLLPSLGSAAYEACPEEVELVARALVPAASRASAHWRRQHRDAARCSLAQLCRATQFPVPEDAVENGDEQDAADRDGRAQGGGSSSSSSSSGNASMRPAVWDDLAQMRLKLVLDPLRHVLRSAIAGVQKSPAGKGKVAELMDPAALQASFAKQKQAYQALQQCSCFRGAQDASQLASSMVSMADQQLQRAVVEAHESVAAATPEKAENEENPMAKMNSALENIESSLKQLQCDWILQGDNYLQELNVEFALIEPIALVEQVERQTGVARTFESMLFHLFSQLHSESDSHQHWFANTGKMYMDGIRKAAPIVARKVIETTRSRITHVLEKLTSKMEQTQWDLAQAEWVAAKLHRLRTLFVSLLSILSGVGMEPLEEDLGSLSLDQSDSLQQLTITTACRGAVVRMLMIKRAEWTWWVAREPSFSDSLFRQLCVSTQAPGSIDDILDCVRQLVFAYAVHTGTSRSAAEDFISKLSRFARAAKASPGTTGEDVDLTLQVATAAAALWKSNAQFGRKELCNLVGEALREDANPSLRSAVEFLLAMAPFLLHGAASDPAPLPAWWPSDGALYRGGWFPDCHKYFFFEGRQFQSRMPLAFSFAREDALSYAQRKAAPADGRYPVVWTVRLDPVQRSTHGYLVEGSKRELLFAPYACFRVARVQWQEDTSAVEPHSIELYACPYDSNESRPLTWPLAPWG